MSAPKFCHYMEDQVRDSGLLSPERMAQVTAEIDARIQPVFDKAGKEISTAVVAECPEGRMLFLRAEKHQIEYMRRCVLAGVLTEGELDLVNKHCLSAAAMRNEKERFSKAEKLTNWDGEMVYYGDKYYPSIEDVIEDCDGQSPEYVWATVKRRIVDSLDVGDVLEHSISNYGWEDMSSEDMEGVEDLQAALDKFVERNASTVSYWPDYTKAILLNQDRP